MKYTLEELQALYGREPDAVSRNAKPLVLEKIRGKWQPIMEKAVEFVIRSYNEDLIALSVRQVHYHLESAARDLGYKNDSDHAKKLTTYMLQARIGELIEWKMITEQESTEHETAPAGADPEEAVLKALEMAEFQTGENPWDALEKYIVTFTEKRELGPQLQVVTGRLFTRLICTRGYGMWSRLYKELEKMNEALKEGKEVHVLYVMDHDPSGLDMNRLGAAILKKFWNVPVQEHRVMLTMDQVEEYGLAPAPTKVKDPRAKWYLKAFGDGQWEVDALQKKGMQDVLRAHIETFIDRDVWDPIMKQNDENVAKTKELVEEYKAKFKEEQEAKE